MISYGWQSLETFQNVYGMRWYLPFPLPTPTTDFIYSAFNSWNSGVEPGKSQFQSIQLLLASSYVFLYHQYGSWGRTSTKAGDTEGSNWCQCPANFLLTKLVKIQSMQNRTHIFYDVDSRGVTEVSFKKDVKLLNNGVANSGSLLNQQSIMLAVVVDK
jgi:hypothetical protein